MLKIQEIREIIKLIDQSSIEKFSLQSEGMKIELKKGNGQQVGVTPIPVTAPVVHQESAVAQPTVVEVAQQPAPLAEAPAVQVVEPQAADPSLSTITSPMVGTFYAASSPDIPAYVQTGDKVKPESVVCIVEAMKLFNEIEAEVSGEIVEILVKDGQLVEFGQPLFLVKAN
jgi:acetyl-CoA carboxylase biotin carboxyl carrier protein